ncbi:MAG: flagellin [Phycisphaerales bacterium]|nr:flagellin [Phycisphaerales bacterium]
MARINTNVSALTAQRNLNQAHRGLNTTMEHLSTGLRISRGKDDPAGLIVSERLRAEISAVGQAVSNTQRAKLIVATAEGALDEVAALLKDIKAKIVEAANEGAFSSEEIEANQLQIDSAIDSITRIANTTTFAGRKLLDGSLAYETSGVNNQHVKDLQIHATQFGLQSSVAVNVNVVAPAEQARIAFPYAALSAGASNITIELRGPNGVVTMAFANGTPASQIARAINSVSDATGVKASLSAGGASGLTIHTEDYGSRQFVTVRTLSSTGAFPTTTNDDRGADAVALINGSLTRSVGNRVFMKNSLLDLEMTVSASTYTTNFNITGGGALFQIGPRVDTNLQVNMAIDSVHASQLGNASIGYLSDVKTGGNYALTTESPQFNRASRVVDEAITRISVLRGRLGSFERNTLDTTANQLNITMENLTSAESTIRDADFAHETSRLARDQILVNAGTTVLTLANQTTQSVLRLLGG